MLRPVVVAIALFAALPEAAAFCSSPSPPSKPWGGPPGPPHCSNYGDLSNCSQSAVDRYRSQIEEYIDDMQEYADDAADFAEDAYDYAKCRADDAVDDWNRFIGR